MISAVSWLVLTAVVGQSMATNKYEVPEARVEVFEKGFQISIPDAEGIRLFAFHGNVNDQINDLEAGQMSKDILKKTSDGRWTYENKHIVLNRGDVITYWLYVLRENLGYLRTDQSYIVSDKVPKPQHHRNTTTSRPHHSGAPNRHVPQSPEDGDLQASLTSCQRVVDNTVESLKTAQIEIKRLRDQYNRLLAQVTNQTVTILPQGLTLGGNLPNIVDGPQQLVNFILWEKLNLTNLEARRASRNPDGTITFEMFTPEEKLEVLAAAKEHLQNSTIFIRDIKF